MNNIEITSRDNHYNLLIQQISSAVNDAKKQLSVTINHTIDIFGKSLER